MTPRLFDSERTLNEFAKARLKPLLLVMDEKFRLVEHPVGNPAEYGIELPPTGDDCRPALPFLYGLETAPDADLPALAAPNGHVVDARLNVVSNRRRALVLVDATVEHRHVLERQQVANEARALNYRLQQLTRELEQSRAEAEQKRKESEEVKSLQSRFIARMSHDFRTPLAAVLIYLRRILQQSPDAETAADLAAAQRAGQSLMTMIDNLLTHGQLTSERAILHAVPTNLAQLLAGLRDTFEPIAHARALSLVIRPDPSLPERVWVDEMRLRQILLNLTGNALKFTERGRVSIELSWKDDVLSAAVSDTGPGIPAQEQERIFLPFYRLADTGEPGAGLGLSISRNLARLMGGGITVDSTPGAGSDFRVRVIARMV